MRIGIIGAGHIGVALTRRFCELNHFVSVANSRGPQTLAALAHQTGASAVTVQEATRDRDIVVVAIPEKSVADLPPDLFVRVPDDVVVIHTGNYAPQRDGFIEEIECGMTESRWVATRILRPVVKAFNNIYAQHLLECGKARGTAGRIALPIAGDQENAKKNRNDSAGRTRFDAVDDGDLDDSWRQQPGTPVFCKDFDAAGVRVALSQAHHQRDPGRRAILQAHGT